ncbi:MAG TPA: DegV family protein [Firmicutes bacterium]|nr:DegV family protein [Bacillota bacterium]
MKKIALVTDSTADLTPELKEKLNVHVIPLKVRFSQDEFRDGELTPAEFYHRLANSEKLPQSSQPSPSEFEELYRKLLTDHDAIISIHLSSGLSGTLNAANLAKAELSKEIHVLDSKNISLGIGLLVREAARLIAEEHPLPQIIAELKAIREKIVTLFTLDTLEYLHKGGRIGKVPNLLGSFLKVKPIVRVNKEGIYVLQGVARSQDRAIKSIVHAFQELAGSRKPTAFFIAHGAAEAAGERLKSALEETFQMQAAAFTQVGPVIGVHTGPGTLGAAMLFA